MTDDNTLFGAVEAILFVAGEPVSLEELAHALDITLLETTTLIERMRTQMEQQGRGLQLFCFEEKVQLRTHERYAAIIQQALRPLTMRTLGESVIQTLSIIAYRQPITRTEIEQYRGVSCDYSLRVLRERGLIEPKGRKDTIGNPVLFGTTEQFMRYFGIESLCDLPPLPNEPNEEIIV